MTQEELKLGIDFLETVKNDYQFDKESPDYLGFLNCGDDITDHPGYMMVVNHEDVFIPIMEEMGIDTEAGIHVEETIFILIED
jgi:hypothetical protein